MKNIFPTILLIASIWLSFAYTKAGYNDIGVLQVKKEDYNKALSDAKLVQVTRDDLIKKYESFSPENQSRLAVLLPDYVDTAKWLLNIQTIAYGYGLSLSEIKLSAPAVIKTPVSSGDVDAQAALARALPVYTNTEVTFNVDGSYHNFILFLHDIEDSLELIDTTVIKIKPDENISDFNHFTVTARTYWLPQKNTP